MGSAGCRSPNDAPTGGVSQEQRQTQGQLQAAALNDSIIQEREGGIANIHRTVQEVSEIFQDLALLVDEQGAHIDNIQTNIESAGSQTAKGVQQLAKASRSQKKNRGRLCCCAVTLLIGLVALVLTLKFATGPLVVRRAAARPSPRCGWRPGRWRVWHVEAVPAERGGCGWGRGARVLRQSWRRCGT